jgi:acyl-CoA reductase-like NAD-dependent aldehyde dehydrogenase
VGKFGFVERVPCGLVVAIAPFNFPLNLVCHKVGPALAGGNAVIVKPASATPLTALRFTELLLEAGLPPLGVQCITGSGSELGAALCGDARVRKVTFTGSVDVGQAICRAAGIKKVTMELGSNAPLIVLDDADLDLAADATVATGYANAGQVCISTQRVIVHVAVAEDFTERLLRRVKALKIGNPELPDTTMGPMISAVESARVSTWIAEAVKGGARALLNEGGPSKEAVEPAGASTSLLAPEILADVNRSMRVWRDELFGPVVSIATASSFDDALTKANDSRFGLSAAVFTRDVDRALAAARTLESGNVHINWGPGWRADLMPYGGLKGSGVGREGPRYAVLEMTELKTVVVHSGKCTD